MPKIDYPHVIEEDLQQLEKLEKRHRYSHLSHRVRVLRLLKLAECTNLGEAAKALGYRQRQCQRWFVTYKQEGLSELSASRVHERGPEELVTEEAFEKLKEAEEGRAYPLRHTFGLTRPPRIRSSYDESPKAQDGQKEDSLWICTIVANRFWSARCWSR